MYLRKCLVLVYGAMVIPFVGISADNVNVALHKPVIASSQQKEFPASNVTDGVISRNSSWTSAKGARTPHMLDLNLQKYYDIGTARALACSWLRLVCSKMASRSWLPMV